MAARVLAALVVIAALAGCDHLDYDELRCEEVVARILACCPSVTQSPVVCEWQQSAISPYIYVIPQVDCLVGLDCPGLQAHGACAWAASPTTAVCP